MPQTHNHDHSKEDNEKIKMGTKKEYACSIHPVVKSGKPGDCPKCGMKLIEKKWTRWLNPTLASCTLK